MLSAVLWRRVATFVALGFACACNANTLYLSVLAQGADPVSQVSNLTLKTLGDLNKVVAEEKGATLREMVGRDLYTDQGPKPITAADVEKWFEPPATWFAQALTDTQSNWADLSTGKLDRQTHLRRCYDRIVLGFRKAWETELSRAGAFKVGWAQIWLAEIRKIQGTWSERWNALSIDDKFGNENPRRTAHKQGEERDQRQWFEATAPKYLALVKRLAGLRREHVKRMYAIQKTALSLAERSDDPHAQALGELRHGMYKIFSYGERYDSTLDFFVGFPGSPDRIITAIPDYAWITAMPYPDIQVSGSANLLKMNAIGKEKIKDILAAPIEFRVFWDRPADMRQVELAGFTDKTIVNRLYEGGQRVRVSIAAIGWQSPGEFQENNISVEVKDLNARTSKAVRFSNDVLRLKFNDRGIATAEILLDDLLKQLDGRVNTSVLEATATTVAGSKVSDGVYFPVRQQLIVFIPGVLGSEIHVQRNNRPVKAFPVLSTDLVGQQPFTYLMCDRNGNPLRDNQVNNEAVRLDLFRTLFGGLLKDTRIYLVERAAAITDPPNHPAMKVGGRREPYYLLVPWAYDWRLRLELAVDTLLGGAGNRSESPYPPYRRSPSLENLLAWAKPRLSLTDGKAVVAGHSTGGVILRGLVNRSGVQRFVSRAIFMNTPFWGAPKAYYVYLTGDMGVPIIAQKFMQGLSPNAPIVYYLAPTEKYPNPVVRIGDRLVSRSAGQAVETQVMGPLIAKARGDMIYPGKGPARPGGPNRIEEWNQSLELAARNYHRGCEAPPLIGWERCLVFWSDSRKNNTVSTVFVSGRKVSFTTLPGDSTVPVVSQMAEFAQHPECLIQIRSGPEHVPAPNEPQVWEDVIARLTRPGL